MPVIPRASGIALALALGAAATPAPAKRAPTSFRFVGRPVVVFYAAKGHAAQWEVIARLNRALPTHANHRPKGDLRIDHEPSDAGPSRAGRRNGRACYVAAYSSEDDEHGAPQLVKPHDRQRVTLTLSFNKSKSITTTITATRRPSLAGVNTAKGIKPGLVRLGCQRG